MIVAACRILGAWHSWNTLLPPRAGISFRLKLRGVKEEVSEDYPAGFTGPMSKRIRSVCCCIHFCEQAGNCTFHQCGS